MYSNLLSEYTKLEKETEDIKTSNESTSIYYTSLHLHCLTLCLTNKDWLCDKCRMNYSKKDKSYYCSVCDYDLCKKCLSELKN